MAGSSPRSHRQAMTFVICFCNMRQSTKCSLPHLYTLIFQRCTHCRIHAMTHVICFATCGKALSAACRISHTLIFQQCTHCRNHAMTFVISATCGKALSAACRTSIHSFFSNALIAEITLKEAGYNTLSREGISKSKVVTPDSFHLQLEGTRLSCWHALTYKHHCLCLD